MKHVNGPLITVITVTYNAVSSIEATIQSVINRVNNNIQFIIIDGGSTDGTIDIINKYKNQITYFVSEPDSGLYDAMNKGWKVANEFSYILYLGSGDKIISFPHNDSFAKAGIIAGVVSIGNKFLYEPKIDIRLKLGNTLHHQALLIKKSLHPLPPFDITFKIYADFDFNQRLLKAGYKIIIDESFKAYAMEGGVSSSFNETESLEIVKKNYGWFYHKFAQLYYLLRHEI
ncbi:glycosyltransferase [Mucilaginibacter pocheonensis]|uniref:Glycosyltransferase involved in cell wall biosynthesis n=1 Tax=Mucilaginibacter pocheonensis TaxID=398050 RepID=A0ABU1T7B8_9SPHI|nr:glycosyltransferase [Mucilaginibacter pocheonensis]MDR6941179.1 glycosyltransferase involved in cell wall biosynthesis [Mucilaginibacter pocheonensis]